MRENNEMDQPVVGPLFEGRLAITVPEAAEFLGLGRATAYRAVRAGQIPAIEVGSRLIVPVPTLLRMVGIAVIGDQHAAVEAPTTAGGAASGAA